MFKTNRLFFHKQDFIYDLSLNTKHLYSFHLESRLPASWMRLLEGYRELYHQINVFVTVGLITAYRIVVYPL